MLSPIQTRKHWIRSLHFDPAAEFAKQGSCHLGITLESRKCKEHWHIRLGIVFGPKDGSKMNYRGRVEFEGIFDVHPDFPPEKTEDMVRMNGGAILYGAIRELILTLTSRSEHGPFEMPTIDARMFIKKTEDPEKPKLAKKRA